VSEGTIIVRCIHCGAIYYIGEKEGLSLQISGANTFEEAKLNPSSIAKAIHEYQDKQLEEREKYKEQFSDKGYPFILICMKCGSQYDSCYNDEPCPRCKDNGQKRWILKAGFEREVPEPAKCTIKNFKPEIIGGVNL
jgi:DNA-directed RNA polymerase subunit RPC12/RpoP